MDVDHEREPQAPAAESHKLTLPEGAERLHLTVEASPGACLEVDLEMRTPLGELVDRRKVVLGEAATKVTAADAALATPAAVARPAGAAARLSAILLWSALAVYLITRFVGLDSFPIYFFTDEAVQTMLAADFLRDGLRNYDKDLLPTFFENGSQYNLGVSVYLQTLPYLFFGRSIWVTRGAAALATLLAALGVGLTLKNVFASRFHWLAVLILSITPAWLLHSRTAFESSLATSFYAGFLYCYLMYRCRDPRYLYGAVVMAALAFYSYSPARVVLAAAGLLLLLFDFGYHRRHLQIVLLSAGLAVLAALPMVRFLVTQPNEMNWQMKLLGSYWLQSTPLSVKLGHYALEYLRGLNPLYWYLPHGADLERHTMPGYGHLLKYSLPFGILGLALALAKVRDAAYRNLLIFTVVVPAGAAIVAVGITRVLFMVVPVAVLTALAVDWLLEQALRRWNLSQAALALPVFALLAAGNACMLRDALLNGPYWYDNYTLTGMQWGARQLFAEVDAFLEENPGVDLRVSPSWANGTDVVARFFFGDPMPFVLGNASSYYHQVCNLDGNQVFVMIPEEYESIPRHLFSEVKVERILPYPNGRPGFYFVRLRYVDNIADLLAEEIAEHHRLVEETVDLEGLPVTVRHSRFDIGEGFHLFDGNLDTLVRTQAINPMEIELSFPYAIPVRALDLQVGGTATRVVSEVFEEGSTGAVIFESMLVEEPLPRNLEVDLAEQRQVREIHFVVTNTNDPPEGHVHLWEIRFR